MLFEPAFEPILITFEPDVALLRPAPWPINILAKPELDDPALLPIAITFDPVFEVPALYPIKST